MRKSQRQGVSMTPNQLNSQLTKQRFMSRVSPEALTGCWLWTGAMQHGYGKIRVVMKDVRAHRASWEIHNGPIPDGMCVLHKCDTPLCVNPAHLFLGTQQENIADKQSKGRTGGTGQHNRMKTHCPQGHPLSGENLYTHKGGRQCKTCMAAHSRKYKESKK